MKNFLAALGVSFIFFGCNAQKQPEYVVNKNDNSLLWMVSGNGLTKPSFLYGTFHLLCKGDINFSTQMKEAVKNSNQIYMEMDMDDPTVLLSGMLYMNMKDGKKIKDLYSPKDYERLENYFKDTLKMPFQMFQKAKPYFLVALFYPKMMNCKTTTGVEEQIVALAKEYKKEISGLETMQFQASVFDSIPYEVQAKELLKNIDSFEVNKKELADMVRLYKNQQLDSLEIKTNKMDVGDEQYTDILLTNRNKNWVKQLSEIMKKESVFVAVGAGHLGSSGDTGLIGLLRKAGYTVQPLENSK